jgi:hypothetical protein
VSGCVRALACVRAVSGPYSVSGLCQGGLVRRPGKSRSGVKCVRAQTVLDDDADFVLAVIGLVGERA